MPRRRIHPPLIALTLLAVGASALSPALPVRGGEGEPAAKESRTFRDTGDARSVVFVCDAAGSMLGKMRTLKNELHLAVQGLGPEQSFNIVFFRDGKPAALSDDALLPATPENQRKADAFLEDIEVKGTVDPVPALALAIRQKPQVLYLLTDGDFPDNGMVERKIAELNRDHRARINTIAFVRDTDGDTEFLTLLEEIAKANGGVFRGVDVQQLEGEK